MLKEIQRLLPGEDFVFLADQLYVPYGEKNKRQLEQLTERITRFLLTHRIKLLVVACNTATCYAIDNLRNKFDMPIVGTVPAVKPAVAKTRTKTIAVISTPATSRSPALKNLIREYARGVRVMNIGCTDLENAVETGELGGKKTLALLKKYLAPIRASNADYIVLGCTHYPFLKNTIKTLIGRPVRTVDSGLAIAKRVGTLLAGQNIKNPSRLRGKTLYFTTGDPKTFAKVASGLLKRRITAKNAVI